MKRGVSIGEEEPNPYEIEQQRNIEWNRQILQQLYIFCFAAQIKGARPRNEDLCIRGSGDNDMIERTKLDEQPGPHCHRIKNPQQRCIILNRKHVHNMTKISHQFKYHDCYQCSRLEPSYEFYFEGLSNFSSLAERWIQIQDVNLEIQKQNTKVILNLSMNYMVHVFSTV